MPDIVAVAKSVGNGYPIGVVVTREKIADRNQGYFFAASGSSLGSSAIGIAVLNIILQKGLQENAHVVGNHQAERLRAFGDRHGIVARSKDPASTSASSSCAVGLPSSQRRRTTSSTCSTARSRLGAFAAGRHRRGPRGCSAPCQGKGPAHVEVLCDLRVSRRVGQGPCGEPTVKHVDSGSERGGVRLVEEAVPTPRDEA